MFFRIGSLFFLSGLTSLGFEIIWSKQLSLVLGGSTASIAFVIAMFMGGMALGYAAGGKLALRFDRPIVIYGFAELGLASIALFNTWLFPGLEGSANLSISYLLAGVMILPCTFLAGLTLPLLVSSTRGSVGGAVGTLYALNTAGAVCGVMVTGFYLIGRFGLFFSAMTLTALGLLVGIAAIVLGRKPEYEVDRSELHVETSSKTPCKQKTDSSITSRTPVWLWLVISFCLGLASLSEEVIWTRALIPHLNSSTYAFSAILAVFLTGLALGSVAGGRIAASGRNVAMVFVASQVAAGLFVLFSLEFLIMSDWAFPGYVGVRNLTTTDSWLTMLVLSVSRTTLSLLPPTFCIGLALPLLAQAYLPSKQNRGQVAGTLVAWNTVGAVLGSLVARFVLLPSLGTMESLRYLAMVHVLAAAAVAWRSIRQPIWYVLVAAIGLVTVIRPPGELFLGRLVETHKLLFVDEGVQDTTAVVKLRFSRENKQIFSNGIAYAGDRMGAQRYMKLLGHLPSLYSRSQRRALVICLGTGMTASAVLRHPGFESVDLVDISPVVYKTLPLFAHVNDNLLGSNRTNIHIEDGRVFMAKAPANHYDTIALEPPPPRAAGVASLYSVEFYQQAKRILAEGGAMSQWLPLHGMTYNELAMLTRSFLEVFPKARLIEIHHLEAALVATKGPGAKQRVISKRANIKPVGDQLSSLGIDDVLALPSADGDNVIAAIGPGPVVTDDHPRIEYFASGLDSESSKNTDIDGSTFLSKVLGTESRALKR